MGGQRVLRGLAVSIALALAAGVIPAAAAPPAAVSVVAGDAATTTLSRTAAGLQRTATVPGIAALRFATTPAQVRAALGHHLRSLGSEPAARPQPDDGPQLDGIFPVGDLNGDRRNDLVLSHYVGGATQYTAVAGDSGRRLWRVDGTAADRWSRETHAVGLDTKGKDGVLLLSGTYEEIPSAASWTMKITIDMTAVSGTGETRWTRSSTGFVSFSDGGVLLANLEYPLAVGPVNGAGDDVVMSSDDAVYSFGGGGASRVQVLDGETGRGGAVVSALSQDGPAASGVPGDVDGDGLLDIVTATSGAGQVMVVAYKGTDGRPLWSSVTEGPPAYWVDSAGRTDNDKADDVLLVGIDWEAEHFFASTVVSGADGAPGWSGYSDGLLRAGDVSGDGLDDLLLLKMGFSRKHLGVTYNAVTGTGRTVYDRTYAVAMPKGSSMAVISAGDVGDVDGDGSVDLMHDISVFGFDNNTSARESGVVLTRTGRKIYDRPAGYALGASIDGRGDDLVRLRRAASGVEVTARDGLTQNLLWRRTVSIPGYRGGFAMGADLTRDGRAEVILVGRRSGGAALKVIDGRTQDVRWGR